jgi:DNA-binding NarL/FixJ family response regulator
MRIMLADDQKKVRFALRVLLEQQPELEVVGEAYDCPSLLAQIEALSPDVVLVDWKLPGLDGGRLMPLLRRADLAVIVLSPRLEDRRTAVEAGASAFVCKCDAPERLLAAIASVAAGETGADSGDEATPQEQGGFVSPGM